MAGTLKNRVALVTGGASGMGRATAVAFAREGAKVAVVDVQAESGGETVDLISQSGGEAIYVPCDVAESSEVSNMVRRCVEVFGRIDCALNCAGILGEMTTTDECTEENFDQIMRINLRGLWLCMKYEIRQMLQQGSGAIVNMASNAGMQGTATLPAYAASKAGVVSLTQTAALEVAGKGIRINCINPGLIRTAMVEEQLKTNPEKVEEYSQLHPIGRIGTPQDIAEAVVWLCSDAAAFVVGHPMNVDGGYLA